MRGWVGLADCGHGLGPEGGECTPHRWGAWSSRAAVTRPVWCLLQLECHADPFECCVHLLPWQGYSWAEDKEHCEEYGRMLNADPSKAGLWVTGGWELRLLERHPKVHSRAVKHFEHSACHQLIPPLRCLPATGVGACQEAGAATDGHPGGGQPLRRDSGGQSSPWLACIVCRCA